MNIPRRRRFPMRPIPVLPEILVLGEIFSQEWMTNIVRRELGSES